MVEKKIIKCLFYSFHLYFYLSDSQKNDRGARAVTSSGGGPPFFSVLATKSKPIIGIKFHQGCTVQHNFCDCNVFNVYKRALNETLAFKSYFKVLYPQKKKKKLFKNSNSCHTDKTVDSNTTKTKQ